MNSIDATLARLTALHPKLIDLSLDRMWRILAALDHPEQRLPPVIHVAGTNGKGSTIAFMRAICEAAGLRTHVYTSPHLVRFNERIRLGASGEGVLVTDAELAATLDECERINAGESITVFEITTAAALLLFSRRPADVLLLEVGLGGRLDSTNVVDRPLATAITPVSLDHADHLGDDVTLIAHEKAGILKRDVPGVLGPQPREALRAIERQAARVGTKLSVAGEDWIVTEERGRLVYQDDAGLLDLPAPRLYGRHQFDNAGIAIATLRASGLKIAPAACETGLAKVEWPARMQRLLPGKLTSLLPPGSELWLDGGHNADGGRAIATALADLEERVSRPLVLIVGMLSTKDHTAFLRNFAGLGRRLIAISIPNQEKALSAEAIAQAARDVTIPAETAASIEAALSRVAGYGLDPPPRVLMCGSLYLAGEILAANGTQPS